MMLVPYSGGLDSCAMSVKLLTDPKIDKIWFHHFGLIDQTKRSEPEYIAWKTFREWALARYAKKLILSESILDLRFMPTNLMNMQLFVFNCALICQATFEITQVALGRIKDDEEGDNPEQVHYIKLFNHAKKQSPANICYPVLDKTKGELYKSLPLPLKKAWWSCKKPTHTEVGFYPCKKCPTCKALATYNIEHHRFVRRQLHGQAS